MFQVIIQAKFRLDHPLISLLQDVYIDQFFLKASKFAFLNSLNITEGRKFKCERKRESKISSHDKRATMIFKPSNKGSVIALYL